MKDPKSYPNTRANKIVFSLDNDCKLRKPLYATIWRSRKNRELGIQLSLTPDTRFPLWDKSFYCISPEVVLK